MIIETLVHDLVHSVTDGNNLDGCTLGCQGTESNDVGEADVITLLKNSDWGFLPLFSFSQMFMGAHLWDASGAPLETFRNSERHVVDFAGMTVTIGSGNRKWPCSNLHFFSRPGKKWNNKFKPTLKSQNFISEWYFNSRPFVFNSKKSLLYRPYFKLSCSFR